MKELKSVKGWLMTLIVLGLLTTLPRLGYSQTDSVLVSNHTLAEIAETLLSAEAERDTCKRELSMADSISDVKDDIIDTKDSTISAVRGIAEQSLENIRKSEENAISLRSDNIRIKRHRFTVGTITLVETLLILTLVF